MGASHSRSTWADVDRRFYALAAFAAGSSSAVSSHGSLAFSLVRASLRRFPALCLPPGLAGAGAVFLAPRGFFFLF